MDALNTIITNFGLNQTILWMGGLFLITFAAMYFLVFADLTKKLVERDLQTEGREEKIAKLSQELADLQEQLDEKMMLIRAEAAKVFSEAKARALESQKTILNEARLQAAGIVQKAREDVAAALDLEMKKVQPEVPALAGAILEAVMNGHAQSKQKSRNVMTTGV